MRKSARSCRRRPNPSAAKSASTSNPTNRPNRRQGPDETIHRTHSEFAFPTPACCFLSANVRVLRPDSFRRLTPCGRVHPTLQKTGHTKIPAAPEFLLVVPDAKVDFRLGGDQFADFRVGEEPAQFRLVIAFDDEILIELRITHGYVLHAQLFPN